MTREITTSIKEFTTELSKRLEINDSRQQVSIQNTSSINEISRILHKEIMSSNNIITKEMILALSDNELEHILNLINIDEIFKKSTMNKFNPYKSTYNVRESINDPERIQEIDRYFNSLASLFTNHLNDYENNQEKTIINENEEKYKKYIELLNSKKFTKTFEEIDELIKLMKLCAVPDRDKANILRFIAESNMALNKDKVIEKNNEKASNLYDDIDVLTTNYLSNEELTNSIQEEIVGEDLSLAKLDSVASYVAKVHNLNYDIVYNVILTMMINTMYNKNPNDVEEITSLINNYKKINNDVIAEASQIIESTKNMYDQEVSNGTDISEYFSMSIDELKNSGYEHNQAIDLKSLYIIKTIRETVSNLKSYAIVSNGYTESCGILSDLITSYNNMMLKKQITKQDLK